MSDNRGRRRIASASAPGSCGELAQGMLNGVPCMITCPIDVYSTATVELSPIAPGRAARQVVCGPPNSPKARRAALQTLRHFDADCGLARLSLTSTLPRRKGMASSAADVVAAITATAAALGENVTPDEAATIALQVEPSDGIMFPSLTIFDHREGRVARRLGASPPMRVVALDFGGHVDTLEFNRVARSDVLRRLQPRMEAAVSLIEDGVANADPARIGRGATVSALANQEALFNPNLQPTLKLAGELGAVGVNVAHSGSVIGMLFADDAALAERAAAVAKQRLAGLK